MPGSITELHTEVPASLEAEIFGQFDEYRKQIERALNVTLVSRDGYLKILGSEQNASLAKGLVEELGRLARGGTPITRQNVTYGLAMAVENRTSVLPEIDKTLSAIPFRENRFVPRPLGRRSMSISSGPG